MSGHESSSGAWPNEFCRLCFGTWPCDSFLEQVELSNEIVAELVAEEAAKSEVTP